MIPTLIQGLTIFILVVMIIKHLKPNVENFTQFKAKELREEIKEYDDVVENETKNFHKLEVNKDNTNLFKGRNPTFGSIHIETRVRSSARKTDGLPDLGTYDCPKATMTGVLKTNKTLEQCATDCKSNNKCLAFRWNRNKKCILTDGMPYGKYKTSKCLNDDKVYVYNHTDKNINPVWTKNKFIYYPKLKDSKNKKSKCFNSMAVDKVKVSRNDLVGTLKKYKASSASPEEKKMWIPNMEGSIKEFDNRIYSLNKLVNNNRCNKDVCHGMKDTEFKFCTSLS